MEAIAVYPLNNVSGLVIYAASEDTVLVGLNEGQPVNKSVDYDEDGRAWFEWGDKVYLDECIRV